MIRIDLPLSKSMANRLLIIQAKCGDALLPLTSDMPDDVVVMHRALTQIAAAGDTCCSVNVDNCGTAMRFLTAYCASTEGIEVIVDGSERMRQRPICPLVEALGLLGADIEYMDCNGFPPLHIRGRLLPIQAEPYYMPRSVSSQFVSALLLAGLRVTTKQQSPYIDLTRRMLYDYCVEGKTIVPERDWSSAAFWYEHVALFGGELLLTDLTADSRQGDRIIADYFLPLGVQTEYTPQGAILKGIASNEQRPELLLDCQLYPDLYPALAVTAAKLGHPLRIVNGEGLKYKESNRLKTVDALLNTPPTQIVQTYQDHRIAMAAMIAGYQVDDTACVNKSYPLFMQQLCKLHE